MGTLQGKLKFINLMKVTVQENEQEKDAVVQRYVNILSNAGFKALFGDRKNKEVVISILNTLLPEHRQVMDIDYLPILILSLIVLFFYLFHLLLIFYLL